MTKTQGSGVRGQGSGQGMGRPVYPAVYEAAWRAMAMAELDFPADAPDRDLDRRLRPVAESLSDGWTVTRGGEADSPARGRHRQIAYGLYFFPQTWMRAALLLGEALARSPELLPDRPGRPLRLLDLGAGAGAGAWGALDAIAAHRAPEGVDIVAVDREASLLSRFRAMAEVARARHSFPIRIHTMVADAAQPPSAGEAPDLLLSVFAANEWLGLTDPAAWADWAERLAGRLAPDGALMLCEPAAPEIVRGLGSARDRFAADGRFSIRWPCPHRAPCPLLAAGGDHCHEVRRWTPPPATRRWGCALGRDIGVVKFSGLLIQNTPAPPAGSAEPAPGGRMVAPMLPANGRLATRLCGADGRAHPCECLTRSLTREERHDQRRWERGDSLVLDDARVLGDGVTWRAGTWRRVFDWGE
jgi:ribosomal protein RSM22 (predicted rRNA methylase)